MSPDSQQPATISATLRLKILDETVELHAAVPAGKVRLDEVLPLLRQIDDLAIDRSVAQSESAGRPISCCRGCSACCRDQPVPVTPGEAYALWLLVARLPEPRQSEVRAAFADRVQRLDEAGLAEVYLNRNPDLTNDEARQVARSYFSLGLVCPFLENDACGIYHDRPFVCRQYLVTSPAALCNNPFDNQVDVLPMPLAAASGFQRVSTQMLGREQFTIPLTLALAYVERHRDELERTFDSIDLADRCVRAIIN